MATLKAKIAGVATFAAAASTALIMAASASAVTTPASAITNDPNAANGSITFYDAAGHVAVGGNDLTHLFDYAAASSAARPGATKATLYFAFPDSTKPNSTTWFKSQKSSSTNFPNPAAPAPINGFTDPVVTLAPTDGNLAGLLPTTTLDHSAGYDGIVQVRVYDSGPGVGLQSAPFWASDIYFDQTANTWQQVFPSVASTTISAISASTANPAPSGTTSVGLTASLTASDSSHPAGSVELFDGSTDVGAATYNAATGAISDTATVADSGSYNFKFVFTPTVAVTGSSSPVLAYSVAGPAQATATVVTGPTTTTFGTAVTLHADVNKTPGGAAVPASAGAVQFKVDGTNSGSPVPLTATGADFSFNPPAAGSNVITATFVPANPAQYVTSSDSTGVTVVTTAPQYAPDPQNVTVNVPQGTLVISTPYTVNHPFKLGTMVLNAAGTGYSASAPFGDPAAAAGTDPGNLDAATPPANITSNGVTITDTRAGSTGWTASAQTTDFTNGNATPISGDNLSFTGVTPKYITGNALQAGSVNTHDITAFKAAKKAFADTTHGPGTVNITGVMGLTAPTSTLPGDYTAAVTFTIV